MQSRSKGLLKSFLCSFWGTLLSIYALNSRALCFIESAFYSSRHHWKWHHIFFPSLIPRPRPPPRKRVCCTFSDFWGLLTQQSWYQSDSRHVICHVTVHKPGHTSMHHRIPFVCAHSETHCHTNRYLHMPFCVQPKTCKPQISLSMRQPLLRSRGWGLGTRVHIP